MDGVANLNDPRFVCLIFGCDWTAENSVRMTWGDGHSEAVGFCRGHTDRRHRLIAGPGPVSRN